MQARRRPLAAVLAGVAVLAGLRTLAPPPVPTVEVLVAARDLAAGSVVGSDDVLPAAYSPGLAPHGLADDPVGRVLAAPLRQGEPVTDVRLVGPSLTEGYDGLVAVPVRLPDAGAVALLQVGDQIDLVATDPEATTARTLAAEVPVVGAAPGGDRRRRRDHRPAGGRRRSARGGRGHRRRGGGRLPQLRVLPLA